jgi:hypothetical protein
MSARKHKVMVSVNDQELARLDEMRGDEERAVYLRRLLHQPQRDTEVATDGEAMVLLTWLAHDGRTTSANALAEALRAEQPARFYGLAERFLTDERGRLCVYRPRRRYSPTSPSYRREGGRASTCIGTTDWWAPGSVFADDWTPALSHDA